VATHTVGLERLCNMYDDMPSRFTVNLWRYKHPEFSFSYAQAKLMQADLIAEDCLDIADDATSDIKLDEEGKPIWDTNCVNRARLRIDTRKWLAAKLLPKQYGAAAEESKDAAESVLEQIISGKLKVNTDAQS
jgi:hypothetical protein